MLGEHELKGYEGLLTDRESESRGSQIKVIYEKTEALSSGSAHCEIRAQLCPHVNR